MSFSLSTLHCFSASHYVASLCEKSYNIDIFFLWYFLAFSLEKAELLLGGRGQNRGGRCTSPEWWIEGDGDKEHSLTENIFVLWAVTVHLQP